MASTSIVGEPYALAGKRMPLLSWRYVRPGLYAWLDRQGNNVTVHGDLPSGEARLSLSESPRGVRLVVEPAKRIGPILNDQEQWEANGFPVITTLIHDGGTYRAWGKVGGWGDLKNRGHNGFCLYESDDGVNWRSRSRLGDEGGSVFIDPSATPSHRYKWISDAMFTAEQANAYRQARSCGIDSKAYRRDVEKTFGLKGATSPDGVKWTELELPLALMHADTQATAYFDTQSKTYVAYVRDWAVDPRAASHETDVDPMRWIGIGRRAIGRTESSDFREFPISQLVLEPPLWLPPSQVLYTNCRTSYPGAPDQHLMFPAVWDQSTDRTDIRVAVSRDGKLWDWLGAGEPPPSATAEPGQWDGGCIFASPNLVELRNGDFALPYQGYDVPHKYPRMRAKRATGYAIWSKGRLGGIRADEEGAFATIGIVPPGQKLLINARGGSVLVEAAEMGGAALPGRSFADAVPIEGDAHRVGVRWKSHDALGTNGPVMLRVQLKSATVYDFEFA